MKINRLLVTVCLFVYLPFVYGESIFQQYKMPPIERATENTLKDAQFAQKILEQARVLKRAQTVDVPLTRIEDPQTYQETLFKKILSGLPRWQSDIPLVEFTGTKVSELNQLLKSLQGKQRIKLVGQTLQSDEPLFLPSGIFVEGHGSTLVASTAQQPASIVIAAGTQQVGMGNIIIQTPGLGIHIEGSEGVFITNVQMKQVGRGIAILNQSRFIELDHIGISQPLLGGILIQGEVSQVWLHDSYIYDGTRSDNGGAGLLISDAYPQVPVEKGTEIKSLEEPILPLQPAPHEILIENSRFGGHLAQGIYVDGGYGLVIVHNHIAYNDKEGLCLDFGAVNNVVMENVFHNNGFRSRQTDEALRQDHVLGFGRMADGSAVSKLPSISLDNAAQNIIIRNVIRDSAGDGIKLVRTGIRNFLLFNVITDNNRGTNNRFSFFGILLGSAQLETELAQHPSHERPIDFLPPIENIIAGNVIYGKHRSGILLDHDAAFNDIYDNVASHYQKAPLEQATTYHNSIVGNSWQLVEVSLWWTITKWTLALLVLVYLFTREPMKRIIFGFFTKIKHRFLMNG